MTSHKFMSWCMINLLLIYFVKFFSGIFIRLTEWQWFHFVIKIYQKSLSVKNCWGWKTAREIERAGCHVRKTPAAAAATYTDASQIVSLPADVWQMKSFGRI